MNCQFETLLLIFSCVHTHKSSSSHTSCSISQTYFPVLFLKGRKHLIPHAFPASSCSCMAWMHSLALLITALDPFRCHLQDAWIHSLGHSSEGISAGGEALHGTAPAVMVQERMKGSLSLLQIWILRQTSFMQYVSKPL